MNLPNVQEHYDQIVFEEYDFASYLRCPGTFISFRHLWFSFSSIKSLHRILKLDIGVTHSTSTRPLRSRSKGIPECSTTRMRARDRFRVQLHPHRPRLAGPRRQPRRQEVRRVPLCVFYPALETPAESIGLTVRTGSTSAGNCSPTT